MLVPVLAWVSAILGLFIGINFILPSSTPAQHNIGCYLTPINYTSALKARLALARQVASPLLYQHKSLVPQGDLFDKQLMSVAATFEKYVQQLGDQQRVRVKDHQILSAIHQAQESFTECQKSIKGLVDSAVCNKTWSDYLNCFEEVDKARRTIKELLTRQKEIQKQIKSQMQQPIEKPTQKPEFLAQLAYNDSIKANEAKLADLQHALSSADSDRTRVYDLKSIAEDRFTSKNTSYTECYQNRRIYRHCEQISEKVKDISSNILDQLKQQLKAKTRLMNQMMEMMERLGRGENRKVPQHWKQMFQKHKQELKRMHLDIISYTNKEIKSCGCSEKEEKLLLKEVKDEEQAIQDYELKIKELNQTMEGLRGEIVKNEQEKEKIIQEYQKALKEYDTIRPVIKETNLIKLKKTLQANREDILKLQDQYNQIDFTCKAIKSKLAGTIKDIDKVEDCLEKKEYLKKLRAETAKHLQPERSLAKLDIFKKELAQVVEGLSLKE